MKPWEVIATLIKARQLFVVSAEGRDLADPERWRVAIMCPRTGHEITLDNVRSIQVEHWPKREAHGGEVSPDNGVISLAEGHKQQTKREQKADAKERRLHAKRHREVPLVKRKFRLKKKLSGEVVKVRTR